MTTEMDFMIIVGTPLEAVDHVLEAIADAGGGTIGKYTHCAFVTTGQGRFKPDASADPYIGHIGQINSVEEGQIQTFCSRTRVKAVVKAIRGSHPYEEPVIYILPLISESNL